MFRWFKRKPKTENIVVDIDECLTDITIFNAFDGRVFGDHVEPSNGITTEDVFDDFVRITYESYQEEEDAKLIVADFAEFDRDQCQGVEPEVRNQMFLGYMLGARIGAKMMHARISRNMEKLRKEVRSGVA